jgi:hypothetical protein
MILLALLFDSLDPIATINLLAKINWFLLLIMPIIAYMPIKSLYPKS